MNTTTIPRTARTALVLLLALLVALTTMAPAVAAPPATPGELTLPPAGPDPDPTGPGDITLPDPDPDPDPDITGPDDLTVPPVDPGPPTVTIDVAPHCDAEPGLTYDIEVGSPPEGALAFKAQWRGADGVVHTVDGQSGVIATGEGSVEIRGVLHHQGPGFYATEFVDVVIDCADDTPDDAPRPGTPNFTG